MRGFTPVTLLCEFILLVGMIAPPSAQARKVHHPPKATPHSQSARPNSTQPSVDFSHLIGEIVSGKQPIESLRIEAQWPTSGLVPIDRSITLYGSGVGIWNGSIQFTTTQQQLRTLAHRFEEAKFGAFPDRFGASGVPLGSMRPVKMLGSVVMVIGNERKAVFQLAGGEQSTTLQRLAEATLSLGSRAGLEGTSVASLQEGLTKIANGELAPETLIVRVNSVVQNRDLFPTDRSWLLRLNGYNLHVESFVPGAKSVHHDLKMPQPEIISLARSLASIDPVSLPSMLFAPHYTDLYIKVLDQEKSIQAGPDFPNLGPHTLGKQQDAFNSVIERLSALDEKGRG